MEFVLWQVQGNFCRCQICYQKKYEYQKYTQNQTRQTQQSVNQHIQKYKIKIQQFKIRVYQITQKLHKNKQRMDRQYKNKKTIKNPSQEQKQDKNFQKYTKSQQYSNNFNQQQYFLQYQLLKKQQYEKQRENNRNLSSQMEEEAQEQEIKRSRQKLISGQRSKSRQKQKQRSREKQLHNKQQNKKQYSNKSQSQPKQTQEQLLKKHHNLNLKSKVYKLRENQDESDEIKNPSYQPSPKIVINQNSKNNSINLNSSINTGHNIRTTTLENIQKHQKQQQSAPSKFQDPKTRHPNINDFIAQHCKFMQPNTTSDKKNSTEDLKKQNLKSTKFSPKQSIFYKPPSFTPLPLSSPNPYLKLPSFSTFLSNSIQLYQKTPSSKMYQQRMQTFNRKCYQPLVKVDHKYVFPYQEPTGNVIKSDTSTVQTIYKESSCLLYISVQPGCKIILTRRIADPLLSDDQQVYKNIFQQTITPPLSISVVAAQGPFKMPSQIMTVIIKKIPNKQQANPTNSLKNLKNTNKPTNSNNPNNSNKNTKKDKKKDENTQQVTAMNSYIDPPKDKDGNASKSYSSSEQQQYDF